MKFETLIYEKADRIATVTLNRPEKGNALSRKLRDELDLVMDDLDQDDETRVLVVKAAGNHFSTGYDLTEFSYLWDKDSAINDVQRRPHRRAPIWSRREFHLSRERWMRLFRLRQATIGIVYVGYLVYALVRGTVAGVYPYPFIDVGALGYGRTAINAAGVTLGFSFVAALLVAIGRSKPIPKNKV